MDSFTPPAWPPFIHFRDWPVPPPPLAYIREDDYLAVSVLTSGTTTGLALRYRILQAAGGVIDGAESLDGAELNTLTTHIFKLTEGFLLSATVSNIGGGLADQVCGVVLALQKGGQSSTAPHTILAQGYVSNIIGVTWPVGLPRGPATSGSSFAQAYVDSLADVPPASAGALDDEFDGAVFDTTRWTWQHQGSATVAQSGSHAAITLPYVAAHANALLTQPLGTLPKTVSCKCDLTCYKNFSGHTGLWLRESGTDKMLNLEIFPVQATPCYGVIIWTDYTNPSTQPVNWSIITGPTAYLRWTVTSTDHTAYVSQNGKNWIQIYNALKATAFTANADQVGIGGENNTSTGTTLVAYDWLRST